MNVRRTALSVLAVGVLLTTAACGSDDASDAGGSGEMDMSGMVMDEPDATPADQVDGEVAEGSFEVLDTAPPGSEAVAGEAFLAQQDTGDAGTTVTIRLDGLEPGTTYMAHLHDAPCATDDGGDHFTFDPDGSDVPPNEIHLGFTADADGTGEATVTNAEQVGDGAPSVVVHPADAMDNRLACADFS